jgi:hypothetical protein
MRVKCKDKLPKALWAYQTAYKTPHWNVSLPTGLREDMSLVG